MSASTQVDRRGKDFRTGRMPYPPIKLDRIRHTNRLMSEQELKELRSVSVQPEPARILLAEDDADMRHMLVEELESAGFEVEVATDGHQLLDKLASSTPADLRPDLVVSDIRMPGLTGLEVLSKLRDSNWAMPVIIITAFGDRDTHIEARRLGAAQVFDKPFDLDQLVETVRELTPGPV